MKKDPAKDPFLLSFVAVGSEKVGCRVAGQEGQGFLEFLGFLVGPEVPVILIVPLLPDSLKVRIDRHLRVHPLHCEEFHPEADCSFPLVEVCIPKTEKRMKMPSFALGRPDNILPEE